MGFWMQFVRPPADLPAWYEPIDPAHPDRYQLTFGGRFEVAAAMYVAGLLDVKTTAPELPRWEDVGLSPERGQELLPYLAHRPRPGRPTLADVLQPQERLAVAEY